MNLTLIFWKLTQIKVTQISKFLYLKLCQNHWDVNIHFKCFYANSCRTFYNL